MEYIPEPTKKISPKAITVWRTSNTLSNALTFIILITLLFLKNYYNWYNWIGIFLYIIIGYVILHSLYKITIHPIYLQRTWRYEIDKNHIQLKHGFFHTYHLIVPMSRVEYVNTNQGPLLRKFGLSSITIGTVASSHTIPALTETEAKALRYKIAHLANVEKVQTDNVETNDTDE